MGEKRVHPLPIPSFADTAAYWLEDDAGNRVSKLFGKSESPLRLAGRVLENTGSLEWWSVARRDGAGARHVVASGRDLEIMATPFMPVRTRAEAEAVRRFNKARRALGFRHSDPDEDERVY